MDFQIINHKWLYKEVVLQLENYIRLNELKIGDRLPTERYLSEQLGISRGTIREAYRTLEVNGIIESRPGGGRFLKNDINKPNFLLDIAAELDNADALDLLELREVLEVKFIELVVDRASPEDIEQIEEALNRSEDKLETDNFFHLALAEASHNNAYFNFMKYNLSLLTQIRKNSLRHPGREKGMMQEHSSLLTAIKEKNKDEAKRIIAHHIASIRAGW